MKKKLTFAFITLFTFQINAQTLDQKIERLLELDGTISSIENLIIETIKYQKQSNPGVLDNYWEGLSKKISTKSLVEFKSLVTPIYSKIYTEVEIGNLISFYNSKTGKLITEKQPILLDKLNLPLIQWSQNLNSYVIEEIENKGKNESSSGEIEKFKTDFKSKYGLQILNLKELAIDQEYNFGSLLIDFGKTDGKRDITKVIRVKNNSNKEITFEKPLFLITDDIRFDWGNKPVKIGETRDLKITLIAEQAESQSYSSFTIKSSEGNNIPVGIKYDAPVKEINFEVSDNKLKFKKLKQDLSNPYIFILKNIGKKDFYISDIEINKKIAYLNYSKETIKPNQETEIRVIISKELLEKQNIKNLKLTLEVDLTKGEKGSFSNFSSETIELKIE
ncbi:MAG: hypothetical protein COA67_01345 [Lutibacter sp.]|nr:MAG: hypothetical protein COA67_01345 [Lutibacter sp.]